MAKGPKGLIFITNGQISRGIDPSTPIPEGFWRGKLRGKNKPKLQVSFPEDIRQEPLTVPDKNKDEETITRIRERFEVITTMTEMAASGNNRAMIISGGPGLSKSYTVETTLRNWDPSGDRYEIVKGKVLETGLYQLLWERRHPRQVLVFDDADQIFFDEVSLNILKAVCDSTKKRSVHRLSLGILVDKNGGRIPRTFDFEGSIIFITNYDFNSIIQRQDDAKEGKKHGRLVEHLDALMSRSHYIDTTLHNRHAAALWCNEVERQGVLLAHLNEHQRADVMEFFNKHIADLKKVDLRMILKLADIRQSNSPVWEKVASVTSLKEPK